MRTVPHLDEERAHELTHEHVPERVPHLKLVAVHDLR